MGEFEHGTSGFASRGKSDGGEHEFALVGRELVIEGTGFEVAHGFSGMQTPGEFGKGIVPGGFQSGIDLRFLALAAKAEGFEVGAVLAIKLLCDLDEDGHAFFSRDIAQSERHFAAHASVGIGRHLCGHG